MALTLVHDERCGNQSLLGGIDRQGQTCKSVGPQQGGRIVFSEDYQGDFALAAYRDPRLSVVQVDMSSIGQRGPCAFPSAQSPDRAAGCRATWYRRPRCPRSPLCPGPDGLPCWKSAAATLKVLIAGASLSRCLPPHLTRLPAPAMGGEIVTTPGISKTITF